MVFSQAYPEVLVGKIDSGRVPWVLCKCGWFRTHNNSGCFKNFSEIPYYGCFWKFWQGHELSRSFTRFAESLCWWLNIYLYISWIKQWMFSILDHDICLGWTLSLVGLVLQNLCWMVRENILGLVTLNLRGFACGISLIPFFAILVGKVELI